MALVDVPIPLLAPPLLSLIDCLCEEVNAVGPVCWCGLLPGDAVAWDHCSDCGNDICGMAWVRVAAVFPFTVFPTPTLDPSCTRPLAAQVEAGVLRCMPVNGNGEPVTASKMSDVVLQTVADMHAVHRAFVCCAGASVTPEGYLPVGPLGFCVGGVWTGYIEVP